MFAGMYKHIELLDYLKENGYKKNEIMKEVNYTEYRLNLALQTLQNLDMKRIIEMLSELSKLDILYKTDNSISDNSRFELFILGMLKKK